MLTFRYHKSHCWLLVEDNGTAKVGLTEFAQEQLGDIVYVETPDVDREIHGGEEIGIVESVKTNGELCAPVSGTVLEINQLLEESPDLINTSAMDDGWIFRMTCDDTSELDELMTEEAYLEFVASQD